MGKIIGLDGFSRLMLGREININQIKTKTFTVAQSATVDVLPGDLLIRTNDTQMYITPDGTKTSTTASSAYSGKEAGIALATNVKTDVLFPQSPTEVGFKKGEQGAVVVYGEVAVKLYGTAPKEGDDVYYNGQNRAFCGQASGDFKISDWKFSGITEGNLTVVMVK